MPACCRPHSGPTCAKVRKVQGTMSLPQGLLSLPHCLQAPSRPCKCPRDVFMHPIRNLADTLLPPVAPHPPPDPTTRFGKEQHLPSTVRGTMQGLQARKNCKVCDSSPPDPKSQSPMRFSYYPPNFSPFYAWSSFCFPPSLSHTLHQISLSKGQHTLSE